MTTLRVTLDLYSGRPNPQWILSQEQAATFQSHLNTLVSAQSASSIELPALGYRGLRVNIQRASSTAQLLISSGLVIWESGAEGGRGILSDPGRELEKWLLHTGSSQIGEDLVRHLSGD
jgi:hypothetical protein